MAKKTTKIAPAIKTTEEVKVTSEDVLKLALEKGYKGDSLYDLQGWIMKKYFLHAEIFYSMFHHKFSINNFFIDLAHGKKVDWNYSSKNYESYDDALIVALYNMLILIKNE